MAYFLKLIMKAEKMTTRDPLKKEMAEQKKEAAFHEAERMKHETRAGNVAARREHGHNLGHGYAATGTGATGHTTGTTGLTSAEGALGEAYTATGGHGHTHTTGGVRDPRVTGRGNTGYGSGATY